MQYKINDNIYSVHYMPCDMAFYLFNSALRNLHVKEYYLTFRYSDNNTVFLSRRLYSRVFGFFQLVGVLLFGFLISFVLFGVCLFYF